MVEPLFKSEGSVYTTRRETVDFTSPQEHVGIKDGDEDQDADEEWVDKSIPSTPVHEEYGNPLQARPSSSSSRARSTTPHAADIRIKREHSPHPSVGVKDESPDDGDLTPPLREINADDLEEMDAPPEEERQCRICFAGKEEEGTMGRLISPCLCTGSVRVSPQSCPLFLSMWGI